MMNKKNYMILPTLTMMFLSICFLCYSIWTGTNPYAFIALVFAGSAALSLISYREQPKNVSYLLGFICNSIVTIVTIYFYIN